MNFWRKTQKDKKEYESSIHHSFDSLSLSLSFSLFCNRSFQFSFILLHRPSSLSCCMNYRSIPSVTSESVSVSLSFSSPDEQQRDEQERKKLLSWREWTLFFRRLFCLDSLIPSSLSVILSLRLFFFLSTLPSFCCEIPAGHYSSWIFFFSLWFYSRCQSSWTAIDPSF